MYNFDRAKEYIKSVVDKGLIPGAQFGIIGEEDMLSYYGYSQIYPEKIALKQETLYDLASLSKVVSTNTLILKLIEEGYFDLNTKLKDILTDFPYEEVDIKGLLTHTSGMVGDDKAYKSCKNKQEMYEFIKKLPLVYPAGTKVEYSDFAFICLGFVIEHFKGNLKEYANESIFKPLGMDHTKYQPDQSDDCVTTEITEERGVIKGVCHDGKGYRLDGISGNAGVFSNVSDLAKFVHMILNYGEYNGNRILKTETINLLKNCYTEGLNNRRTLGWIVKDDSNAYGDYASDVCLFHTGFTGTSIYIDFVRNMGIILLTNRVHPSRDNDNIKEIRNNLHNIILGN